jgi:Fuc2NAc and GlcNAc transferase
VISNIVIAAAFLVSLIATDLVRRYAAKRNLLDIPNSRSSHTSPMPRGGGVAIVLTFFAAVLLLALFGEIDDGVLIGLLIGGGITALIGFIDDRWPQSPTIRFGVHLVAAVCVLNSIGGVYEHTLGHWGLRGVWIGNLLGVVTVVWTTNLFNFMDGIDGIAASEAIFVLSAGAGINWLGGGNPAVTPVMLCLAACCLGFLRWNWPPARIFMGDVGSGFLGFSIAVLGLAASKEGNIPIEVWGILGGVFLVDATLTLLRRMVRGDRWFEAHRMHAYQRLARRWKAHLPVTSLVIFVDIVWLLPWAILAVKFPVNASWFLAAALAPLLLAVFMCGAGTNEK